MANTRQSGKRAGQAKKREAQNIVTRSATKTAVRKAVESISKKTAESAESYILAIKALSKAASKGGIPKARAARKISRLTKLAKKVNPSALNFKN